jgi:hypothetical protein
MEYAIFIKWDKDQEWIQLSSKWYISPKKAIAAYKATPYPREWNEFYDIKIIERTISVIEKDISRDAFGI